MLRRRRRRHRQAYPLHLMQILNHAGEIVLGKPNLKYVLLYVLCLRPSDLS